MTKNNGAREDSAQAEVQGDTAQQAAERYSGGADSVDQIETGQPETVEAVEAVEAVLDDNAEDTGTTVDDGLASAAEPAEIEAVEEGAVEEQAVEPSDADIIAQLRQELAAAQALVDENIDKLQRSAAEFQNARKRQERRLAEAIDRANVDLIRRLLPIVDDLDLAFENAPAPEEEADGQEADLAWVEGFLQIRKKLLDLLLDHGVTPIDASGEFDPMLHEAVLSEPSDEVESGHIIAVLRTGYEYKGQVLRPAMVRVAA